MGRCAILEHTIRTMDGSVDHVHNRHHPHQSTILGELLNLCKATDQLAEMEEVKNEWLDSEWIGYLISPHLEFTCLRHLTKVTHDERVAHSIILMKKNLTALMAKSMASTTGHANNILLPLVEAANLSMDDDAIAPYRSCESSRPNTRSLMPPALKESKFECRAKLQSWSQHVLKSSANV